MLSPNVNSNTLWDQNGAQCIPWIFFLMLKLTPRYRCSSLETRSFRLWMDIFVASMTSQASSHSEKYSFLSPFLTATASGLQTFTLYRALSTFSWALLGPHPHPDTWSVNISWSLLRFCSWMDSYSKHQASILVFRFHSSVFLIHLLFHSFRFHHRFFLMGFMLRTFIYISESKKKCNKDIFIFSPKQINWERFLGLKLAERPLFFELL